VIFVPILKFCIVYSVDRNLSERIEIFAQERRGQSCNRMVNIQPPLPADFPTILVRPPLPTDDAPNVMDAADGRDVAAGGATPTTAEPMEVTSSAAPARAALIAQSKCYRLGQMKFIHTYYSELKSF